MIKINLMNKDSLKKFAYRKYYYAHKEQCAAKDRRRRCGQNKDTYNAIARIGNLRARIKKARYLRDLKNKPCSDCGIKFHFAAMEFDHVRGEKLFDLGHSNRQSWQAMVLEAKKCDVVCANCHRLRTWNRNQEKRS